MKKRMILGLACLLAGCSKEIYLAPPEPVRSPLQGSSPDQCIHVEPSSRALEMKEINFYSIANQIRGSIAYNDYVEKFQNLNRVSVDYTVLPAEDATPVGKKDCKPFAGKPKRYYVKLGFFKCPKCSKTKACEMNTSTKPDFEETITMPVGVIPANEGIRMLVREVMVDQSVSPLKTMTVNLNEIY